MRIDSSGRLLVGSSSARSNFFNSVVSPRIQLEGAGDFSRQSAIISSATNPAWGAVQILAHQKSGSIGGNTLVANNDSLGLISFQGSDGNEFVESARIESSVDGTPGANDMPGRLVFSTTANSAASPTERMRITSDGEVTKANQPGFLARRSIPGDNRAMGAQEWTVGGTASFNTGSHFNTTNGRFTAPVAGRYLFSTAPGYKQTGQDFNFYVQVNGVSISEPIRFIDGGDDLISHSTATGTVILSLAVNDYVTIYVGQAHHANTTYNFFCGYLLG